MGTEKGKVPGRLDPILAPLHLLGYDSHPWWDPLCVTPSLSAVQPQTVTLLAFLWYLPLCLCSDLLLPRLVWGINDFHRRKQAVTAICSTAAECPFPPVHRVEGYPPPVLLEVVTSTVSPDHCCCPSPPCTEWRATGASTAGG